MLKISRFFKKAENSRKVFGFAGGGAFFGKVGSFEEGYEFDAVILDDSVLPHPQSLNLAERMERAVYLGLDEKNITAKYVAGEKIVM